MTCIITFQCHNNHSFYFNLKGRGALYSTFSLYLLYKEVESCIGNLLYVTLERRKGRDGVLLPLDGVCQYWRICRSLSKDLKAGMSTTEIKWLGLYC